MLNEFKKFIMRGNVVDMAVGIIIGAAFGTIVKSLVADVMMPPIGLLLGGLDFSEMMVVLKDGATPGPYASVEGAKAAGAVVMSYGMFINAVINLLIVGFAIFMLIRGLNKMKSEPAPVDPTTRECPHCLSAIPIKAKRCAHCTSEVPAVA